MNKPNTDARVQLRQKILDAAKPKSIPVNLFGQEIELRQPTLKAILEAQEIAENSSRTAHMIIEYAFVPGTNDRVFDETDTQLILDWPFGDDLIRVQKAITDLTGVDITAAEGELTESPLEEPSLPTE